jgi:hypothetical protein
MSKLFPFRRVLLTAICGVFALLPANCAGASGQAIQATGVALTPAHFPNHKDADIRQMFEQGQQVGSYAVFIYQWSQPDFVDVAKKVTQVSRAMNLTPVVGLSPTKLSGLRGDYDLPRAISSIRNPSFADKPVHEMFLRDAVELAKLKPEYLCLGTEINLLAFKSIKEYLYFAHVYKVAYQMVKKESPNTKVFVSFQWDFLSDMYKKEPNKLQDQKKLIDVFRPELDVLAFTSYPADRFGSPAEIPADYYGNIEKFVKPGDPVMFMEIGWPSTGKGSPEEEAQFINRLPQLMKPVHPMLVAWSLLHDVGGGPLGGDLSSTGLLKSDGTEKPAFSAFRKLGH